MSTLIQDSISQVESSGDIVIKDIVYSDDYHTTTEEYVSTSNYILDSTEVQEFSRVTYGTDSSKENGEISFQTLSTNSTTSSQTLPITINTVPEKTTITTTVDDSQITSTFGIDGLSFDSDTSSIFFGADSTFRIKYESSTPARLLFQYYNTVSVNMKPRIQLYKYIFY